MKRKTETESLISMTPESLIGKRVTLFGLNYIYTGNLASLTKTWACLEDAAIVYETGPFNTKEWQDAQKLPHPVYVKLSSVESFMVLK